MRASTIDRTPTATATLDPTGAASYEFDIAWTFVDAHLEPDTAHVHSGSIAAYQAPGADTVERMLAAAREHATVSFDPNIRPLLLDDRPGARRRTDRWVELSDVVKASDEDLRWLQPNENPVDVAQSWLERGPAIIVVTRGKDGAVVISRAGTIPIPPIRVTVADTVGAGDSFMAAMLDGLAGAGLLGGSRRTLLAEADLGTVGSLCTRAARAAAITVSRQGANPPSREELDGAVVSAP